MATPFIMPKFDMDQESARIVEWLRQEGDFVEQDEVVLVVETDKVAIDVPAPAAGWLARVTAHEGEEVPVATVIAYVMEAGESLADLPPPEERIDKSEAIVKAPPIRREKQSSEDELSQPDASSVRATPIAQRIAERLELDLADVEPSGDRITREDIERYLIKFASRARNTRQPSTPAARRLARERKVDLTAIGGSGPAGRVQEADVIAFINRSRPALDVSRPVAERIPLTGSRKTIAEKMTHSVQVAPHIALDVEVDVSRLERNREELSLAANAEDRPGITFTALLVKAVASVLRHHRLLNSSVVEEEILVWEEINIGVATALDEGLIVPVIHGADVLTPEEISRQLRSLTEKARSGRLALQDVQNGTFTVTNLGMFGIDQFRAIINPPECAILAVGRVTRRPIVFGERDEVQVRPMMNLTLSADHRAIDGAVAARFLSELKEAIENPKLFL